MSVDYYRILKVSRNATVEQIKVSYRNLAKLHHPDMCTTDKKEAENTFKVLSAAYQVLGNTDAKAAYDRSIGNFSSGRSGNAASSGRWNPAYSVRPANQKARAPITRDMFDVETWHACHYGDGLGENPTDRIFTVHANGWVDPTNKHQAYYRKKYARDQQEKETGFRWSADAVYNSEAFQGARKDNMGAADASSSSSSSSSSSGSTYTYGQANSSSENAKKKETEEKKKGTESSKFRYEPTYKTRTGGNMMDKADFFVHEKHFAAAVNNLEKSRQERAQQREKNTTANTRTTVFDGGIGPMDSKVDGGCVIS